MAELYPSDTELSAQSGTTGGTGLPHMTIGQSPYYVNKLKRSDWLDRVLAAIDGLRVYKDGDLTFGVRAGKYMNGDTAVNYAGSTANALTNNQTNYIYLTAAGTLTTNITGFPVPTVTPHIPLATIVTSAGSYSINDGDITDYRDRSIFQILGAAAGDVNALDWQESLIDEVNFVTSEPGSPSLGDRYLNTATGSSSGTGQSVTENRLYEWNGTSWTEITPTEGACCLVEDRDMLIGYNGSAWVDLGTFANIRDITDGGNADSLHTHAAPGIENGAVGASELNGAVAGDGLQGGGGSALAVDVSDFAGTGLEDDGSENLRIATSAAGDGLTGGGASALAVNVDDSTVEINADTVRVKDVGITVAKCASAVQDLMPNLNVTAGAEAADKRTITVQARDAADSSLAERVLVRVWIATSDYGAPSAAGNTVAVETGTQYEAETANAAYKIISDATGKVEIGITISGAASRYIMAEIDGRIYSSGEVTWAA